MKTKTLTALTGLFVLVLLTNIFAVNTVNALNVADYLYATESATTLSNVSIALDGSNYVLVSLAGKDILVLLGEEFVEDQEEIENVLTQRCLDVSYPSSSELDEIRSLLLSFNESRNAETSSFGGCEDVCRARTGQDDMPCYDDDTCRRACFSYYTCSLYYQAGASIFLEQLLRFGLARAAFDGNMTDALSALNEIAAVNSAASLTFDISEKLDGLKDATNAMKTTAEELEENGLFEDNPSSVKFNCCPPLALNTTSLSTALSRISSLISDVACFDGVASLSLQVADETSERIEYYMSTKRKVNLLNTHTALMERAENLSSRGTAITSVFSDDNITAYSDNVRNRSISFYNKIAAGTYDLAGEELSALDAHLDQFDSYLASVEGSVEQLLGARENASACIGTAEILIESSDAGLYPELEQLKQRFDSAETAISAKLTYAEAQTHVETFAAIANETAALIDRKRELVVTGAQSVFADAAHDISLSVLETIADPLGIREDEKRAWMANIPLILMLVTDVIIIAAAFIAFFFLVWGRSKEFLRRKVINTWLIIFAVLIILLVGLTFAINSMIIGGEGQASFFAFMDWALQSDEVILFVEYSSTLDAAPIKGCAQQLEGAFTALNKTATTKNVIDGVCGEMMLSECLRVVGQKPMIRLKYADENATSFYTFYRVEAEVTGDAKYFDECVIAKLVK